MDIGWILTDKIRVTRQEHDGSMLVESLSTPYRKNITLSIGNGGRLLFNGEDIETEDFMAYVGLLDEVNDSPGNPVIIEAGD